MSITEKKELIVAYIKEMARRDMVNLFEGNISMRVDENKYLITPSQTMKETMTSDMIVEIDRNGNILNPESGKRASSEYKMHIQAYDVRPDITCCIHNHSIFATAFAVAGKSISSRGLAEALQMFNEIPLMPYGTPGTSDIAAGFEKYLCDFDTVLLANHGLFSVGTDMSVTFSRTVAAEKIAKIQFLAHMLGGESSLPDDEVLKLKEIGRKINEMRRNGEFN